ncbi:hypothetical protein ZWY2020_027930 [Hordeum vulgare]|nr:hypothetical protein ZWY2020_027930 [Hordeum vulgare]
MFWHEEPKIEYYVEYTKEKLQRYIQKEDDNLPLKNADGTVSHDARLILEIDNRATITTDWSWFQHHANIREGAIRAFHFKNKRGCKLSLTVARDVMTSTSSIAYACHPFIVSS